MDRTLLSITMWLLFLGGVFGLIMGLRAFFGGGTPAEYGVMGIGGGFWLLSCSITIYIRSRVAANPQ